MQILIDNGNIDAPRKDTCSTIMPPTDGAINAPGEYRDVNSPEIRAYISILSGNPPVEKFLMWYISRQTSLYGNNYLSL